MALNNRDLTRGQRIRQVLMIFTLAISSALLLSGMLAYHYGPSGCYLVQNTLLSPNLIQSLDYNDTNSKTGGNSRFVFDHIQFSYFDPSSQRKKVIQVSPEKYDQFYQIIAGDKSLSPIPEQVQTSFYAEKVASLAIEVRTESHATGQDETKIFQQIDFVPEGNFYRIELHEEKRSPNFWVYFNHPEIYRKVLNMLIPSP